MKKIFLLTIVSIFAIFAINAQKVNIPQIGVKAPEFKALSTNGVINFPSDFGSNWKILFSHPKDFTPVCSSEIFELAQEQKSFDQLGAKLVVVSLDNLDQHNSWKAALEEIHYKDRAPEKINFPIVADVDKKVSTLYGMLQTQESISENVRGVYIIDPENTIRAIYFYPNEVGRNIEELKRTLESLKNHYAHKDEVTPANWEPGDDIITPVLSKEDKAKIGTPESDSYQVAWFLTFRKAKSNN
jgi:peroxiredoxin 2/4